MTETLRYAVSPETATGAGSSPGVKNLSDVSRVGGYHVSSLLRDGNHAVLFHARNPDDESGYIAKLSRRGQSDAKIGELLPVAIESSIHQVVATWGHPHIIPLTATGEEEIMMGGFPDTYPYLVTPEASDGTLDDLMRRGLTRPKAMKTLTELADAVDTLHDNGVRHRDIKPSNVFVHKGVVLLGDFGSAVMGDDIAAKGGGSPGFYAPEVAVLGSTDPDVRDRVDAFSFGSLAYGVLTGRRAFPNARYREIIIAPEKFGRVLDKAIHQLRRPLQEPFAKQLALRPEERYPNTKDFVADVDAGLRASAGARTIVDLYNKSQARVA